MKFIWMALLLPIYSWAADSSQYAPETYINSGPPFGNMDYADGIAIYVLAIIVLAGVLLIGGALLLNSRFARRKRMRSSTHGSEAQAGGDVSATELPNKSHEQDIELEKKRRKIA